MPSGNGKRSWTNHVVKQDIKSIKWQEINHQLCIIMLRIAISIIIACLTPFCEDASIIECRVECFSRPSGLDFRLLHLHARTQLALWSSFETFRLHWHRSPLEGLGDCHGMPLPGDHGDSVRLCNESSYGHSSVQYPGAFFMVIAVGCDWARVLQKKQPSCQTHCEKTCMPPFPQFNVVTSLCLERPSKNTAISVRMPACIGQQHWSRGRGGIRCDVTRCRGMAVFLRNPVLRTWTLSRVFRL